MDKKIFSKALIKDSIPFCTAGVIFIFITGLTKALSAKGNLDYTAGFTAGLTVFSILFGILIGFLINLLIVLGKKYIKFSKKEAGKKETGLAFLIAFILLLLSILPYFLAYYPGILAYDSYVQIGQIYTGEYNEHHPLIHTLLIKFSILAGVMLFKNLNAGIAIYTGIQSILLSAAFAYGISLLYKKVGRVFAAVMLFILMVFPFNAFMAVSVTKDVFFTAFFLLMILVTTELLGDEKVGRKQLDRILILVFSGLGCTAYRNNGKYAIVFAICVCALTQLVLLISNKKDERKVLRFNLLVVMITLTVSMIIGIGLLKVASVSLNAVQGDRREMLSVPIQQLARTYVYHSGSGIVAEDDNTLDERSKALINEFLLNESALLYKPSISDPVKRNTNTWVVTNKTKEFISVYTGLFFKHPDDYINAFLALNAGFLDFTDETHAHINENPEFRGLGYVQTRWEENTLTPLGFSKDSKWNSLFEKLENWSNDNSYLKIPVLKYIFMPGIYFWLFVFASVYAIKEKKFKAFFALSLIAGYYLTMLFGPCVQLRYVYPVMTVVPFMFLIFGREQVTVNKNEKR
ncbi:MAG: DUF6020 family protein [Lachnospiraceae bacterium]|nr:DUF6020 family protein [Lachnospiraceae bacterium]